MLISKSNSKISNNIFLKNIKFRSLLLGLFLFNCSDWIERLCISWIILNTTESILATTSAFAVTQVVQMISSPFTGGAADKFGRNKITILNGFGRFIILTALAYLIYEEKNFLTLAYIAAAINGLNRSFIVPSIQGNILNSVKNNEKIKAMLFYSLTMRSTAIIGTLIGGALSIFLGIEEALLLAGGIGIIGAIYMLFISKNSKEIKNDEKYFQGIYSGLKLVFGNFYTRNLLIFAGIVEIFGFSFFSLLSSISKFILNSEIGTLSILQSAIGLGSVIGIILLFKWKDINKAHVLTSYITIIFGISIFFVTIFPNFFVVVFFLLIIGGCSACFDAIQWIFLQKNIPDHLRSTAVSAWFITIGFGWTGHIILGFLSDNYGLKNTTIFTGIILMISGIIYLINSKKY
ncbi:MAG: MFS transporter [Dehalococcoidia bacterium]|nr:MFS transporter [Dehalococcoidia bacterium]